jgi:hypothetical protein
MFRTPAVSVGHALDVASADVGIVHSVFAHAVNLVIRGDLWTLLAEAKPDLPFGIRVPLRNFEALELRTGDSVNVRAGFLGIGSGRMVVDCRAAARWIPSRADKLMAGVANRLAVVMTAARGRSWHGSAELARAVRDALDCPDSLHKVLHSVVGRGPGSTPSGDDVLVGIFAVLTSLPAGPTGARHAQLLRRALRPFLPTTTDISRHLLRQAAQGLFGRPVHELVSTLIGDASSAGFGEVVRRVIETGATSGADTCEGLLEFAPTYFIYQPEKAAA